MAPAPIQSDKNSSKLNQKSKTEFGLTCFCWLAISLSLVLLLAFSFGRDQTIYAQVADGLLHGDMPYRDQWDFKPPGIFFLFALAQSLFGKAMISIRILELLGALASVWACLVLGTRLFESRRAGLLAATVASIVHSQLDFWHSAQPEVFAGTFTLLALVFVTNQPPPARRWLHQACAGVLFGSCFLLKPPLAGGALACSVYLGLKARQKGLPMKVQLSPLWVMGLASAIPLAGTALFFWLKGAWSDLAWTLFEFAPGYTKLSWVDRSPVELLYHALTEAFLDYSSIITGGFLLLLALPSRVKSDLKPSLFIFSILAFQIIGIALQGKFFQYHYAASIGLLSLFAGRGFDKLWRSWSSKGLAGLLAFIGVFLALSTLSRPVNDVPEEPLARAQLRASYLFTGGLTTDRQELDRRLHFVADYSLDANRKVAAYLAEHVNEEESIYVWGFEPSLYWLSNRRPASRYIYNVPQRALWQSENAKALLLKDLQKTPPQALVIQRRDVFSFVTGNGLDSKDSLPDFSALKSIVENNYALAVTIEDFEVFLLRE